MNNNYKTIFYCAIMFGTFLLIRKPINKVTKDIYTTYRAFKPCNYKYDSD